MMTQIAPDHVGPGPLAGPAAEPVAVELRSLDKYFGTVHAVRGVDLTIHLGEVMAFLGPNGAGKTSTIDLILGLSRPTSGAVKGKCSPTR
jgi:ABC-2 type transport system ATP-binding protein